MEGDEGHITKSKKKVHVLVYDRMIYRKGAVSGPYVIDKEVGNRERHRKWRETKDIAVNG